MSTPMTSDQIVAQFKKWGVKYTGHQGWSTHNRAGHGAWGPMHGILLHHTGSDGGQAGMEAMLYGGRSDLPGPLCHWGMRVDGTAVLMGWGRANHAGIGSSRTRDHIIKGDYSGDITPGPDDVDGNAYLYGQETEYSGSHTMDPRAYANTVKAFAAVCDFHGWSAKSCIGHKEHTSRKTDPGHLDMAQFRSDVQAALDAKKPTPTPAPVPTPTPAPVPTPSPPVVHVIALGQLVNVALSGALTDADQVKLVQAALVAEKMMDATYTDGNGKQQTLVDGHFGAHTKAGYKKWQEHEGYTGTAADGIPGLKTLTALGDRHNFTVMR